MIAGEFNAALLAPLPYGTCLEHSGFRGSMTLRPETMMQIIRDLADELQRQAFKILIVVNGHGGNYALGPVIRDINRMDRPLKILLVAPWEFRSPEIARDSKKHGLDIHAGEVETSVMMALRPDLVRPLAAAEQSTKKESGAQQVALRQQDLDTFGVGHFSPAGAIGDPSLASPAKGEAIIASVRERMLPHLQERIAYLSRQSRYAGSGGIALRAMANRDIEAGMSLVQQAGWNQTAHDWQLFLEANPAGCFVAVHQGEVIGTITTIRYGSHIAWISMLLVDTRFRRMGVGQLLMQKAMGSLEDGFTLKLDATELGKDLYQRLGFRDEYTLQRLTHSCMPALSPVEVAGLTPLTDQSLEPVMELDRQVFGADRSPVLRNLWSRAPELGWCLERQGRIHGYYLGRHGSRFSQVGPIVAETGADAFCLVRQSLSPLAGRAVVMDVPDEQAELLEWLRSLGFVKQRGFIRMVYGADASTGILAQQFAMVGPEFG